MVYYAVGFTDYLQDNGGTGEKAEPEQYYSKIMSYETDSGRSDTLYQADGEGNQTEVIIRDGETEGEMWDVIPSLTGQKIYWYDTVNADNETHPAVLYSYELKSKAVSTEKDGLDLSSPYE